MIYIKDPESLRMFPLVCVLEGLRSPSNWAVLFVMVQVKKYTV